MRDYKFYCDLDGVLAWFVEGYKRLTGWHFEHYIYCHGVEEAWEQIGHYGNYKFWSELPETPWKDTVWPTLSEHNPTILTSVALKYDDAVRGKKDWCERVLKTDNVIVMEGTKSVYCKKPTDILIDDNYKNRCEWRKAGGLAFPVYDSYTAAWCITDLLFLDAIKPLKNPSK